jgi:hypothetical protein
VKPDAERQRDTRRRMRRAGFVLRQLWVHPEDWSAVKRYVEQKRKRHADEASGSQADKDTVATDIAGGYFVIAATQQKI